MKEYAAGISTTDLSRKHGIGESTIYAWNSKYTGMEVSELKRLRQLDGGELANEHFKKASFAKRF